MSNSEYTKLPWFKFFASDWISDAAVRTMTSRQKGWYIDLLAYCWQEDGLPDKPDALKNLTSFRADWQYVDLFADDGSWHRELEEEFLEVVAMFRTRLPDDRITHPKIHDQRHKMQELSDSRTKKARHAAQSRWHASSTTDATSMLPASPSIASRTEKQQQNQIVEASVAVVSNIESISMRARSTQDAAAAPEPPAAALPLAQIIPFAAAACHAAAPSVRAQAEKALLLRQNDIRAARNPEGLALIILRDFGITPPPQKKKAANGGDDYDELVAEIARQKNLPR